MTSDDNHHKSVGLSRSKLERYRVSRQQCLLLHKPTCTQTHLFQLGNVYPSRIIVTEYQNTTSDTCGSWDKLGKVVLDTHNPLDKLIGAAVDISSHRLLFWEIKACMHIHMTEKVSSPNCAYWCNTCQKSPIISWYALYGSQLSNNVMHHIKGFAISQRKLIVWTSWQSLKMRKLKTLLTHNREAFLTDKIPMVMFDENDQQRHL